MPQQPRSRAAHARSYPAVDTQLVPQHQRAEHRPERKSPARPPHPSKSGFTSYDAFGSLRELASATVTTASPVPRSDRTRPATKADARQYIEKASQFLASMEAELAASRWDSAIDASRHLKRLIDKKALVEYEQRRLIRAEALDLAQHARRFVGWAEGQVPRSR